MKTSTRRFIGVLIFSSIALASCSRAKLPVARSGMTEAEAQTELEQRLLRSAEVRVHLDAIRKALEPIEAALRDVGKFVTVGGQAQSGDLLSKLMGRLEQSLRQAGKGVVQKRENGGWVIERPSPRAMEAGHQGSCARSRVRAENEKVDGTTKITVSMSSCESPETFQKLAVMVLQSNGDRSVDISLAAFAELQAETINLDPCKLHIEPKGDFELTCLPTNVRIGEASTMIEHLAIRGKAGTIQADLRATIRFAGKSVVKVIAAPNATPRLDVCLQGGESCSL